MEASKTCDLLITYVKKSNLNFCLNESPFAISISIKKTFVKDKNGISRNSKLSQFEQQDFSFQDQNVPLQTTVANLETYQESLKHAISNMDIKLQASKNDSVELLDEKNRVEKAKELIEGQLNLKNKEFDELHVEITKLKSDKRELIIKVDTMENANLALKRELEDKTIQLREGLENVAIRIRNQRKSYEENLQELKDFKAKKISEEKRQRKVEKKKLRKEKKRLFKTATKHNHQILEAQEAVVGNLFETDIA